MDNTRRFEGDGYRLATAVPEIYALPILGDGSNITVISFTATRYRTFGRLC